MKFDLKNEGTWFNFDEDDESQGKIQLRICAGKDVDAITKKTRKIRIEYKKGNRFEVPVLDSDLYQRLVWDFCIVAWENVQDETGRQMACSTENKMKMMSESNDFANFVLECLDKLEAVKKKEVDDEAKNSSTTPSGSEES